MNKVFWEVIELLREEFKDVYVEEVLRELGRLTERDAKLGALERWGVDNWSGYGEAMTDEEGEDG